MAQARAEIGRPCVWIPMAHALAAPRSEWPRVPPGRSLARLLPPLRVRLPLPLLTRCETVRHSLIGAKATSMSRHGETTMNPEAPAATSPPRAQGVEPTTALLNDIMDCCARGDEAAFDELYRSAAPRVRAFLMRMCGDLSLADDLVQDSFLRISLARGTFAAGAPALPWILAIARNSFRDYLRRDHVRRAHLEGAMVPPHVETGSSSHHSTEGAMAARELLGVVEGVLLKLPVRQREAFVLLRFEGVNLDEAAQILGATQGAVKILVHRALVSVRAAIDKHDRRGGRGF
jgi:RNA polymerase sigma-70 factor (ECF subfamily)